MATTTNPVTDIELHLLLDAIRMRYGVDFNHYHSNTIKRRLADFIRIKGYTHISELIPNLLHDELFFDQLQHKLTIGYTEMFRDPASFQALRIHILPLLFRLFAHNSEPIKIWSAGCGSGEELYSLIILLLEQKISQPNIIYATDIDGISLDEAREGIYAVKVIPRYTHNYHQSGGLEIFSNYYVAQYGYVDFGSLLKSNIMLATHNLAVDQSFAEMQLVVCRNVLIYFNSRLRNRILNLFYDSLSPGGILWMGSTESLTGTAAESRFKRLTPEGKFYQKVQ